MRAAIVLSALLALPVQAQEEAPPEPEAAEEEAPAEPVEPAAEEDPAPREEPVPQPVDNTPPPRASTETAPREGAAESEQDVPQYSRRVTAEEEAEDEDEGDPYDFLWIEAHAAASYVDLRAIDADNYYPEFVRLSGWGPAGVFALGFRIEFLSVGLRLSLARYQVGDTDEDVFDVGTGTAEVTLAIPIPIIKPYARIGIGVGWHGDSNFMAPDMSQTTVYGWVFSGAVGADIYFIDWFAIGVCFSIDVLNMNRQTFDEPIMDPGMVRFEETGDAVGLQGRGSVGISFHF